MIWRHGALPLVFWSPWDRPYEQNKGPDKFRPERDYRWDVGRIHRQMGRRREREFGKPMIVAFGNEMNGDWFPWSGMVIMARTNWSATKTRSMEGPEAFKKAYRHVVDRVRARGAA